MQIAQVLRWGNAISPVTSTAHLEYLEMLKRTENKLQIRVEESFVDSEQTGSILQSLIFDFNHTSAKMAEPESGLLAEDTTRSKFSVFANHNGNHNFAGACSLFSRVEATNLFVKTKIESESKLEIRTNNSEAQDETANPTSSLFDLATAISPTGPFEMAHDISNISPGPLEVVVEAVHRESFDSRVPANQFVELTPKTFLAIADMHRKDRKKKDNKNKEEKKLPKLTKTKVYQEEKQKVKVFNRVIKNLCRNVEMLAKDLNL